MTKPEDSTSNNPVVDKLPFLKQKLGIQVETIDGFDKFGSGKKNKHSKRRQSYMPPNAINRNVENIAQ